MKTKRKDDLVYHIRWSAPVLCGERWRQTACDGAYTLSYSLHKGGFQANVVVEGLNASPTVFPSYPAAIKAVKDHELALVGQNLLTKLDKNTWQAGCCVVRKMPYKDLCKLSPVRKEASSGYAIFKDDHCLGCTFSLRKAQILISKETPPS